MPLQTTEKTRSSHRIIQNTGRRGVPAAPVAVVPVVKQRRWRFAADLLRQGLDQIVDLASNQSIGLTLISYALRLRVRHTNIVQKLQLRTGLAMLCLLAAGLSGCGQPGSGPLASKPVLALDPSDPCQQQRKDFATAKTYFTDEIIANVGGGALIGAAVGGVGGTLFGMNPLKGAAIGAGVGAAAGGVASYSQIMEQKHKDQAELSKSINDDLTKEGQEIDHTDAAFARLRACRFQQAALIKTQVRTRAIDRQSALQQLNLQRSWFAEEIDLAKQYKISMDKRGAQFKDAADEIKQQQNADAAQAQAAASQAQAARHAASVSIPNKRASFDKDINSAEANSDIAFNLDNNKKVTTRRLRHLYA